MKDDAALGRICSHKAEEKNLQAGGSLTVFNSKRQLPSPVGNENARAPDDVRLTVCGVDVEGHRHVFPTFCPPAGPEGAASCVPSSRLGDVALFETSCPATENIL